MELVIKCPKCEWEPKEADLWYCTCGHVWNTFDTGGCCPKCQKRWEDTQCLKCHKFSPHLDWYSNFGDQLKKELEAISNAVLK